MEEDPNLPGAAHEALVRRVGSYSTVTTCRAGPGDDPVVTEGEAQFATILGGRFLREEQTGSAFGVPYHRVKFFGYSNAASLYEAVWIHDKSTAVLLLRGKSTDGGTTIRWLGRYDEPERGEVELAATTRQLDDDFLVQEVYGAGARGERFTVEEIAYTRLE